MAISLLEKWGNNMQDGRNEMRYGFGIREESSMNEAEKNDESVRAKPLDVRFWRHPGIEDVEVCSVNDSRHAFPRHAHDGHYSIGLMAAGGSFCLGREREDTFLAPGQVALINPGQIHSGVPQADGSMTYRMIYVSVKRMTEIITESFGGASSPEFQRMISPDPGLFRNLWQTSLLFTNGSEGGHMETESAMVQCLTELVTTRGTPCSWSPVGGSGISRKGERQVIRRAREILASDLDKRLSLQEVADAVGLSRYHFLRVFHEGTGLSPPCIPDPTPHRSGAGSHPARHSPG